MCTVYCCAIYQHPLPLNFKESHRYKRKYIQVTFWRQVFFFFQRGRLMWLNEKKNKKTPLLFCLMASPKDHPFQLSSSCESKSDIRDCEKQESKHPPPHLVRIRHRFVLFLNMTWMVKMVKNGQKWSNMVKLVRNGQTLLIWPKMVQWGPKWAKMVRNG